MAIRALLPTLAIVLHVSPTLAQDARAIHMRQGLRPTDAETMPRPWSSFGLSRIKDTLRRLP